MRTITPELEALLKEKLQAGDSGFRGRVEFDILTPPTRPELTVVGEASAATDSALSLAVTPHADTAAGDLLIAVISCRSGITTPTYTPPAGWTSVDSASSSSILQSQVFKKWSTGGPVSESFDISAAKKMVLAIITLRGADPTTPILASAKQTRAQSSPFDHSLTNLPVPALTVTAQDMLIFVAAAKANTSDHTAITGTGWTRQSNVGAAGGGLHLSTWTHEQTTADSAAQTITTPTAGTDSADVAWKIAVARAPLPAAAIDTITAAPLRVSRDLSRKMLAGQVEVELANEDGSIGHEPDQAIPENSVLRVYQWYGDVANEVLTFTGLVDRVTEARDPRRVVVAARSMAKRLLDQDFIASAPQGADEDGAVRTAANGVYLSIEVSDIVDDILDRAGWPTAARSITPTTYLVDEYVLSDGMSWAENIAGADRLTDLTGYELYDDEDGVIHFAPVGTSSDASVYVFEAGVDLVSLSLETSDYDRKTRVKVSGPFTTLKDAWTELWHTNAITRPTGIAYDAGDTAHVWVGGGLSKKVYRLTVADRTIAATSAALVTKYLNGLSGDPADSTILWTMDTPWRIGDGATHAYIKKVRKSDFAVLASFDIGAIEWSDIKADASHLWLTRYDNGRIYKRSKTDGSAVADYATEYAGPVGIAIDGSDYWLAYYGRNVMRKYAAGAFTTALRTVYFSGTKSLAGDLDTTTHTELFATASELNLVYKYTLAEPSTEEVSVTVADVDLEDELGARAQAEDRVHDLHSGDSAHPFEIRRETMNVKVVTSLAQATETAMRRLAIVSAQPRVLDAGILGNPAIQRGDRVTVVDPVSGISEDWIVDTYRDQMTAGGTYLGTLAILPYEPTY